MSIEKKDLASDEAINVPLVMAEGVDKLIAAYEKLSETAKKSLGTLEKSGSTSQIKTEIENLTKASTELEAVQSKMVKTAKAYQTSNTEVADVNRKAAETVNRLGTAVSKEDEAYAKVTAQMTAYGESVRRSMAEQKKAEQAVKKTEQAYKAEKGTLESLVQTRDKLNKKIAEEKLDQKDLEKVLKDGIITRAEYDQRLIESQTSLTRLQESQRAVNAEIKNSIALQGQDSMKVNAKNSSLKVLEAALAKNRLAYSKLTTEEQRNSAAGQELIKVIKAQDIESKKLSKTMGVSTKEVGSYSQAIQSALGNMGMFTSGMGTMGTVVNGASRGFLRGATAANIFSLALKAIPIVALIGAIVSLVSWFRGTEEGAQALRIQMAKLEAIFNVVKDRVMEFGKALFEAFENSEEPVKDLGTVIVEHIATRIQGVINLLFALRDVGKNTFLLLAEYNSGRFLTEEGAEKVKMLKEELQKAGVAAGDAFVQALTGVTNFVSELDETGKKVNDIIDEITEKSRRMVQLQMMENKLIVDKRNFLVQEQILQREINKDREYVMDQMLTEEERLESALRIRENIKALEGQRVGLLQRELHILLERQKLSYSDEAGLEKAKQLQADIIAAQAQGYLQQRRNTTLISRLQIEILEREKKLALDRIVNNEFVIQQAIKSELEARRRQYIEDEALLKDALMRGLITRRQYAREVRDLQRVTSEAAIKDQIAAMQKQFEAVREFDKQRIAEVLASGLKEADIILEVAKIRRESAEEQAIIDKAIFDLKAKLLDTELSNMHNKYEDEIEMLNNIGAEWMFYTQLVGGLLHNLTEARIANLDRELAKEMEVRDKLLAQHEGDKQRTAEINETYAAKEEELERKKIQAQRRAAIYDKAVAVVQAGINAASAVLVQLGGGDPYSAFPRAALAGAIAAVQIATILAKPIPRYKDGGITSQRLIIAGEDGIEHYRTPSGQEGFTPGKATVMTMPVGTRITNARDTSRMLAARSLQYERTNDRMVSSKSEKLLGDINKNIKNKPSVIVQGRVSGVKRGGNRIEYIDSLRNR